MFDVHLFYPHHSPLITRSPPHQHLKKLDGSMRENPNDPATADIELGDAAHTGPPPVY